MALQIDSDRKLRINEIIFQLAESSLSLSFILLNSFCGVIPLLGLFCNRRRILQSLHITCLFAIFGLCSFVKKFACESSIKAIPLISLKNVWTQYESGRIG